MCDYDYYDYSDWGNDIPGGDYWNWGNDIPGGDYWNWNGDSTGNYFNWDNDISNQSKESSWYDDLWGGIKGAVGGVSTADLFKYGGLLGSILGATQNPKTAKRGAISQTSRPTLLPGAQAGVNEITSSALPYARANLLNPMGQQESDLYQYLMGGGGGNLEQLLNMGTESRGYLQGGLQDLDINNLISMVAPQITEATMKQFGPYAATKGGAQQATTEALADKAAEFAKQRSDYAARAAGLVPQISAAQTAILPELLNLAGRPTTKANAAYSTYMDTIRALLGLPAGTATAATTAATGPESSIWQRLAPIFAAMSSTGTPAKTSG